MVPIAVVGYSVRPYGYDDPMRGGMLDPSTVWMGRSVTQRALPLGDSDIQYAKLFPLARDTDEMRSLLRFMIDGDENYRELWESARRVSADEITAMADLGAMYASRRAFMAMNWGQLSANWENSIFYQLDLKDAAADFTALGLPEPAPLPACAPPVQKIHNAMLRAEIRRRRNDTDRALDSENEAFRLQRDLLLDSLMADGRRPAPRLNVYSDQIVWARSPVRVDLAGGWSDTPPYPLLAGGAVVNMAVELNGQPPLQAYVKPCADYHIVLRSIDLGATEIVTTGEELHGFDRVGSPFSIPKAALTLAGFSDMFGMPTGMTLRDRLREFGSGLEVTLLSALPAGSGLGTSSILASTVLAAVSEFCGLGWNRNEICRRTVALEQLLTTGGGWQDQYGGVMPGVQLLRTEPGLAQRPV
ncbi:MAG: bifunctional fucokinase/L-fucose-1-P-guanylyltransferase, partial [Paramuribaculum sp.]|nr:bifunctional fucokinase/L-fucose-1-P-guanylyltransferase [Paramuribaculum sp.]